VNIGRATRNTFFHNFFQQFSNCYFFFHDVSIRTSNEVKAKKR
jgi:hypothetical protein